MQVKYVLEIQAAGARGASPSQVTGKPSRIIVPLVTDFGFAEPSSAVLTWNFGDVPTRHISPPKSRRATLSGQSGVHPRFETEGVTSIPASDMSGPALFRRFLQFIEEYKQAAAKAIRVNQVPPVLVIRALWEGAAYYVEPGEIAWSRSIVGPSRHGYAWTLPLDIYGSVGGDPPTGIARLLVGVSAVAGLATRAVNGASVQVARATEFLRSVDTTLDAYREPLRAAYRLGLEVRKFNHALSSISDFPREFLQDFWWSSAELSASVYDTWARKPFHEREAGRVPYVRAQGVISSGNGLSKAALGLSFGSVPACNMTYENGNCADAFSGTNKITAFSPSAAASVTSIDGQSVIVYETVAGDTLQSIARRIAGNQGLWRDIAVLNGFTTLLTGDGHPLTEGTKLYVPYVTGSELTGLDPDSLYGVDLRLDSTGDLVGAGENPTDVQVIRGMDNLLQALRIRFLTERGTNATFPDLGLPRLVGERGTASLFAEAAVEATAQFKRDRRILSVTDISVADEGDAMIASAKLIPVAGRQFDAVVPFPST